MAEDRDEFHRVGGNTDPKANPPSGKGPNASKIRMRPTEATSPDRSPRRPAPRRSPSPAPARARRADPATKASHFCRSAFALGRTPTPLHR